MRSQSSTKSDMLRQFFFYFLSRSLNGKIKWIEYIFPKMKQIQFFFGGNKSEKCWCSWIEKLLWSVSGRGGATRARGALRGFINVLPVGLTWQMKGSSQSWSVGLWVKYQRKHPKVMFCLISKKTILLFCMIILSIFFIFMCWIFLLVSKDMTNDTLIYILNLTLKWLFVRSLRKPEPDFLFENKC